MSENSSIDELDFAIISQLQDDGRKSYTNVANTLGVSTGTVRNRITRMVDNGFVRFICRPDAHRFGFHTPANIKASVRPSMLLEKVAQAVAKFPEVYYLALITGEYDFDIDVMCRDQEHLSDLVGSRLLKIEGVDAVVTSVIMRTYKLSVPDLSLVNPYTEASKE